jgi:hypothetical protein
MFNLVPTDIYKNPRGFAGNAQIVQMFPPIRIIFALQDASGKVTEKKAFVDVWVRTSELSNTFESTAPVIAEVAPSTVPVNGPSPIKHSNRGAVLGYSGAKKLNIRVDSRRDEIFFEEDDDEII